ncbi:helicase-exonuclease AddAB subunit AddA [Convivina intestini]|uniref:helicase-exonuclease AddAB subunit AddA n=1 Tax=Convivina intestini TaxID=1505726 RepID=UPI00200D304A|nr:helicase-exonuclease AddAB subunit AddA [Convivina intestini]CAH1850370.1 ATP-dependent helicase/nuclease subunit A [Convivina intestini]
MPRQFTANQQRAIESSGHNILVAASAGSGKTTVLIERILQKILKGQSVDQFLIVTFTNAAAAEMKERLEKALQGQLVQAQGELRQHLQRQLMLLPVANIATIDAFALKLIENYYYKIGLDPRFRLLSDTAERQMLRQDVVDEVFSDYYDPKHPQYADFMALVDNFANPNYDNPFKDQILRLAEFAQARPDGLEWLKEQAQKANGPANQDLLTSQPLGQHVQQLFLDEVHNGQALLEPLLSQVSGIEELKKTAQGLSELLSYLSAIETGLSGEWDQLQRLITDPPQIKLDTNRSKKIKEAPELSQLVQVATQVKNDLMGAQANLTKLSQTYFSLNAQQWQLVNQKGQDLLQTLVMVTQDFIKAFTARKRQENLLDFADLEVLALEILAQEDSRTLIASQFSEILIDEYQDINQLQESLLQSLSNGHNLYMVGDVKQSIYGFRQADPQLFSTKYHDFELSDSDERIELADNFRSQQNVTEVTNLIFTQLMDQNLGDIAYQDAARLVPRADYPSTVGPVFELDIIQKGPGNQAVDTRDSEELGDWQKRQGQYAHLIQKIIDLQQSGQVYDPSLPDGGGMRPVRYSDIAILTRSKGGYVDLVRMFHEAGLPVQADGVGDYFQTMEVYIMLDTLRVIDNPHQDIPLVAMLRSPMFGLDENDLATIRLQDREHDFWTAFQAAARQNENWDKILTQIQRWQGLARQNDLVGLLLAIYEDTGWLDYMAGMAGGPQRQANLHALYQYAAQYQENQHAGLFRFVRYVEELQKNGGQLGEVAQESEEEAVQLMTIHASKGLEFPIVFLPELEKDFNTKDLSGGLLIQKSAGIGLDYLQPQAQVVLPTLQKLWVKEALKKQSWSEEMRLFYVALTRAKQQLYLLATVEVNGEGLSQHAQGLWQAARSSRTPFLPESLRLRASGYFDWLNLTLARTDNPVLLDWLGEVDVAGNLGPQTPKNTQIQVTLIPENQIKAPQQTGSNSTKTTNERNNQYDADDFQAAQALIDYQYPNQLATQTPAYQSVSEIKRLFEDPDQMNMVSLDLDENGKLSDRKVLLNQKLARPDFMTNGSQRPSTSAVGTATHLLLQLLDFQHLYTEAELVQLRDELVAQGRLLAQVADLINLNDILAFLNSPLGQAIAHHQDTLRREATFAMIMPANQIYQDLTDSSSVLIHGIIDGYFLDESQKTITLFDYKTDYVRPGSHEKEDLAKIKNRYRGQLNLYRQALVQEYPTYRIGATWLVALSVGESLAMD